MFGISQGGLIARAIVQKCSVGKYVKRLITMGGPHQGVSAIPHIDPTSGMNFIVQLCYFKFFQNLVGPCQYIRSLRYIEYLKTNNVIVDLNNEVNVNPEYAERLKQLEVFMAIGFDEDTMIQPKNTSTFGFFENQNNDTYLEMERQEIYTDNRIGLKELNEGGALFRCVVSGDHLEMDVEDVQDMIVGFANHLNDDYKKQRVNPNIKEKCRFVA